MSAFAFQALFQLKMETDVNQPVIILIIANMEVAVGSDD